MGGEAMVRGWFIVEVDLESGRGLKFEPPPGRLMLVGPDHTLMDLSVAIDLALARWDPSHLHEFRFQDGRRFGPVGPEFEGLDGQTDRPDRKSVIDYRTVKAGSVIRRGEPFGYIFDLDNNWRHRCVAIASRVDPMELAGIVPQPPISVWGWGSIPDQHGRSRLDENLDDEPPEDWEDHQPGPGPAAARGSTKQTGPRRKSK